MMEVGALRVDYMKLEQEDYHNALHFPIGLSAGVVPVGD